MFYSALVPPLAQRPAAFVLEKGTHLQRIPLAEQELNSWSVPREFDSAPMVEFSVR